MSATSPWHSANHSPNAPSNNEIDPWATIDTGYLHPSSSTSSNSLQQQQQQQLRSRKSSPAFNSSSSTTNAQPVDRHPLRSPSPRQGLAGPSNLTRPDSGPRRPSAVASEWKAIGAGLAGLFGGSSSNASSSSYQWPADPPTSTTSTRASRQSASHAANLTSSSYHDYHDHDEARKPRPVNTVESTMDRLEDWFGLKQQQSQSSSTPPTSALPSRPRPPASSSTPNPDGDEQVRVLIHPVAPTDTLLSLALHYGADIQVLRKSNKLWPRDPVQIRKVIYIPVDSCKHRPPNAEIKLMPTTGGAVSSDSPATLAFVPKPDEDDLLTGTPIAEIAQPNLTAHSLASMRVSDPVSDFMPDTNKAYTDSTPAFGASLTRAGSINGAKSTYPSSLTPALRSLNQNQASASTSRRAPSSLGAGSNTPSVAASASAASSGFVPPRQPLHVAKVPADQLRFFANDAKSCSSLASASNNPGPGESGIDDLLALAANPQKEQSNASTTPPSRPELARNVSTSNVSGFDDDDDEWRPNTWHFGGGSTKPKSHQHSTSNNSGNARFDESDSGASSNHYAGWNDAPPPHALVAKAYDGGKAHQRRQAQKSHRLLYDLAAGLPANTGAASKWARPIQFGDSLPTAPPGVTANAAAGGSISARKASSSSSKKRGLGKLLDDTIRGRISVEAALEGALEGVRAKASPLPHTAPPPPPPMQHRQRQYDTAPPPSPSNPTPRTQDAPVVTIDPLSSSSTNMLRSTSGGLEQRRNRVDWTNRGKHD